MLKNRELRTNCIVALALVVAATVWLGLCFDFYYDLNDDVLMKDILSGAYLGTPAGRNIQMQWILSFFISVLYRIIPAIPWYGSLLVFFQMGSLFLIIVRTLVVFDDVQRKFESYKGLWLKVFIALSEMLLIVSLMISHLVNLQYTITVAIMSGASIIWVLTGKRTDSVSEFLKRNFVAVLIIFLAFLLRSEMLLLMLPYICAAGLIKWSFEGKILGKDTIVKYISLFVIIILAIGIGFLSNKAAYSSKDWQKFTNLFDARTELYDYQVIPSYEGNENFYDSIGLDKSEQKLFENYNFGIDNKIDDEVMWQVASYAGELNGEKQPFISKLKEKAAIYIYEITHGKNVAGSDYPWNYVSGILYILCTGLLLSPFKKQNILKLFDLGILFIFRTAIWLYILMGERSPDRITHSLYFIEIVVLLSFVLLIIKNNYTDKPEDMNLEKQVILVPVLLCIIEVILAMVIMPDNISYLKSNQNAREAVNSSFIELYDYMASNEDKYYLLDVYSTVSYSEGVFDKRINRLSKANSDILGGWFYMSPVQIKKADNYGIKSYEDALLDDNVMFIKNKERDLDWITDFYNSKEISVSMELVDNSSGDFEIYAVRRQ